MIKKAEPGDDLLLRDPTADILDRIGALNRLATDRHLDVEPIAAGWLTHEMSIVREEAIQALLTYLTLEKYVDVALRMLHEDPAWQSRSQAASSLAFFARTTGKRRPEIANALAKAALHDPHRRVVEKAYFGVDFVVSRGNEGPHFIDIPREAYDMELLKKLAGEA